MAARSMSFAETVDFTIFLLGILQVLLESRDPRSLLVKRRNGLFLVLLGAEPQLPEAGVQKRALEQQITLLLYVVALECDIVKEATAKLKGKIPTTLQSIGSEDPALLWMRRSEKRHEEEIDSDSDEQASKLRAMVPCGCLRSLPVDFVCGKWRRPTGVHSWTRLHMPADGRCFFHAVSCSEHGFPEWKQLSADVRVSRAKALTDLLQGSLPVDVYESYRLGRSVEEEHLETICRALHTYERMHVSRDQDAAFAFGRPEDRHVDLLLCSCESGAEHFDLLIPTVSPNLPKAFKIKARYFDDILDGQKKVESRTDTQKLRWGRLGEVGGGRLEVEEVGGGGLEEEEKAGGLGGEDDVPDDIPGPLLSGPQATPAGLDAEAEAVEAFLQKVPAGGRCLREHQQEGVRFLLSHLLAAPSCGMSGCILADCMGLGKSAQAVRACDFMYHRFNFRTLFVVPKSLLSQWSDEIREWSCTTTTWASITTFEAAGTPVQNSLAELCNLMAFSCPGKFDDKIGKDLAVRLDQAKRPDASPTIVAEAADNLTAWQNQAQKHVLQRGEDVLARSLPACTREIILLQQTREEAAVYAKLRSQSGAAPGLELHCQLADLLGAKEGAKHRYLRKWLHAGVREGRKSVVVSARTNVLDSVADLCGQEGWRIGRLDGSMSSRARAQEVEAFNTHGAMQVFLLSKIAGACGLNLTAASRLLVFEPDYNPAWDVQAMARVWRTGQAATCLLTRLFVNETHEMDILKLQMDKSSLWQPTPEPAEAIVDKLVTDNSYLYINGCIWHNRWVPSSSAFHLQSPPTSPAAEDVPLPSFSGKRAALQESSSASKKRKTKEGDSETSSKRSKKRPAESAQCPIAKTKSQILSRKIEMCPAFGGWAF
ncbi:RAD54 [Symbiodinium microadriaticum]|nr:RAD54 [Symbiodinium microadriaticum]CAE7382009.1 RAD54 [Symbiodinium sp. KB8]